MLKFLTSVFLKIKGLKVPHKWSHFTILRSWDSAQLVAKLTHSLSRWLKVFPGGSWQQLAVRLFTVRSFSPSDCVSLGLQPWSPAGPTTTKACWRRSAQRLNVTGLKGFSRGEKAHILLSVKQRSIVSAGLPSKQTWNYSISVRHMSSSAVHRRRRDGGGILWWST